MSSIPNDAAAIDAPCPICGDRPIEQSATAVRVTGFLIAYQVKRSTVIGCGTCTRNKCLKAALGTLLTGWWSITSAIINPFAILYNVLRAPITRSPSSGLVDSLEESGIEVEFLEDPGDYDPSTHTNNEVLLNGLVQLGVAVMLADGDADRAEAADLREALTRLFPDREQADLESLIQETARENPDVEDVVAGLSQILTQEGTDAAIQIATSVAAADDEIDEREVELIEEIAEGLGLDMDAETIQLLIEVEMGDDLAEALSNVAGGDAEAEA